MKYVIFDFDGTLVDSQLALLSAWNAVAEKYHFKKVKLEELEDLKKISIKERSKLYNVPLYKLPIIMPYFYQSYKKCIKEITLFKGIKELLIEIKNRGYHIAIISSNSKENIASFLEGNEIEGISTILCSSHIFGKDKVIQKFLKENKLNSAEVIYIGDEQRDIVACKKVGIKIVWVDWGYDAFEVIQGEKPDYIVSKPIEIVDVIC